LGKDGLPIYDGVPDQAMVAAIQVAVKWIEIEGDHMAFSGWHIEYRWTADQTCFSPDLAAD
jgi:hypothetical protein